MASVSPARPRAGSHKPTAPSGHAPQNALGWHMIAGAKTAKQRNPEADTTSLEREIDQLVYNLYRLTREEIAIVEVGKMNDLLPALRPRSAKPAPGFRLLAKGKSGQPGGRDLYSMQRTLDRAEQTNAPSRAG